MPPGTAGTPGAPRSRSNARVALASDQDQQRWQQLVSYLRSCVAAEAAGDLTLYASTPEWAVLDLGVEDLVCGTADVISCTEQLRAMHGRLRPGQVLRYGWPVAVLADRTGRLRVAPVLVTEFEELLPEATVVGPSEDEPHLNPALLRADALHPDVADQLSALVAHGLPFGDGPAMAQLAGALGACLSEGSDEIDPRRLGGRLPERPGIYNAAVVVAGESSAMTRSLLEELSELEHRRDWQASAAGHLVSGLSGDGVAPKSSPLASALFLNESQERVLEEIRRAPVTVVTGPPGTGKSQVVVGAVTNAWLDGETILVASANNAAVDVATGRAGEIARALLVRTGNASFRDALPGVINTLLGPVSTSGSGDEVAKAAATRAPTITTSGPADEAATRRDLLLAAEARRELGAMLERRQELERRLDDSARSAEEAAMRVWVAPRPLDELALSIEQLAAAAGRTSRARLLARRRQRRLLKRVHACESATIDDLVKFATAECLVRADSNEVAILCSRVGDEQEAIRRVDAMWHEASRATVVAATARALKGGAAAISAIDTARGGGPGLPRLIHACLRSLRGWSCTALAAKASFPLVAGLFDVVVIDEASQCSLAAVLPLAYRAKRIAVVGDPNQLRPVVTIDEHRLDLLARRSGCSREDLVASGKDYGTGSAFLAFADLLGDEGLFLLEEHYRCHPQIARWFNDTFYGGRLEVLTDVAAMAEGRRGLSYVDVEGTAERGRYGSVANEAEAVAIVDLLGQLLDDESSVAVISPFARQAELVAELATARYGRDRLGTAGFTAGTAHKLQGDERDVIVFSSVVAPGIPPRSAQWVEKERNLINVAASRARRSLVIVGHPTAGAELGAPTLASLRRAAIEGREQADAPWRIDSLAEERLVEALQRAGHAPLPKLVDEGYVLDLALLSCGKRFDIEVDGDQHLDARQRPRRQDLARDRVLHSLGWEVLRVPAWRCIREPVAVASEIGSLLQT